MTPAEARAAWQEKRAAAAELALRGEVDEAARSLALLAEQTIVAAFAQAQEQAPGLESQCAVLTTGGTARREMAPWSDIDVAVILESQPAPDVDTALARAVAFLQDCGQPLGIVLRTLETLVPEARADMRNATAQLRTRLVWGSAPLAEQAHARFRAFLADGGQEWLRSELVHSLRERRRIDETVCLLQPDVKESRGGLRDLHRLRWLAELEAGNAPDAGLPRDLAEARTVLMRLRTVLHQAAGRPWNRLDGEHLIRVQAMVHPASEAHESVLAEERVLRTYYDAAQRVDRACGEALLRDAAGARQRPPRPTTWLIDLFTSLARDQRDPTLTELCAARRAAAEVSDRDRSDPRWGEAFLALLSSRRGCYRALEQMHGCGVLGAWLPEFRLVERLPRLDHYHAYTVDEHLLRSVLAFEELLDPERCFARPAVAAHARRILRPDLLRLALLFHDVGKGEGRGHVRRGAHLVARLGERIGLAPHEVAIARTLVDNHQRMMWMITRRDPEDPGSAHELADSIGDPELLRMLFIHTVCDLRAVSPGSFNDWRGDQLLALHETAQSVLAGRAPSLRDGAESPPGEIARRLAAAGGPPAEQAERFLAHMPERYRRFPGPAELALHMDMAASLTAAEPVRIRVGRRESDTLAEVVIVAYDAPGLFAHLCAGLASLRLEVMGAQIFTGTDGICVDVFQVRADPGGEAVLGADVLGRLEAKLHRIITGRQAADWPVHRRRVPVVSRASLEMRPPRVEFDNRTAPCHTILRMTAPDRPGLLADIAEVLHREGLLVDLALIWTEGYRIVDTFYVTDADSNKLTERRQLARVEEALLALVPMPGPADPPREATRP